MVVLISSVGTEMILSSCCHRWYVVVFLISVMLYVYMINPFFYFAFIIQTENTDELQVCY